MARGVIRFLRRGQVIELSDVSPMRTVLEYLRLSERAKGSKEGCNEGDCGACTVAIGALNGQGKRVYRSVNACILLLGQLDGQELVTVDDLAEGSSLHPVQQAMVEAHASQCGFCTPGFVMSLFTLYHAEGRVDRQRVVEHLAGNLCRCTGYRPIIEAALKSCPGPADDGWALRAEEMERELEALADDQDLMCGSAAEFFAAPVSADALADLTAQHPDAVILGGATDVGLWVTKQLRAVPKIIHTGRAKALKGIEDQGDRLVIGAAVTYAQAFEHLAEIDPDVGEVLRRLGSTQVRNSGTIGGNIANGSPIGDMPPLLIALKASLTLRLGQALRTIPLEDFFLGYGKQDRQPGELVWQISIPKLKADERFRAFKLSKRFDQDISAVMMGVMAQVDGSHIRAARLAFGGMAATPKRAGRTEHALIGLDLDKPQSWDAAIAQLVEDYQPIVDMRASAEYRLTAAQGLLRKALMEISGDGQPLRVVGPRPASRVAL